MTKRYSYKLEAGRIGAGVITLIAMGAGCNHAMAQSQGQAARVAGVTGTQFAFELALAQVAATEITAPAPSPAETRPPYADARPIPKIIRTETTPGTDGLTRGTSYLEADQVINSDDDVTTAVGSVELRQNGRTIRADKVISNSVTGVTTAEGHTQTLNEDGSVQFSDKITYDDNMQSGYSENFASIGRDNSKVFARRLEQVSPDINRLTNVIYTPCALCVKNGETQDPTWSIEASQITQRKDKKMVFYNNAVVKLKGVPVLYAPYLWTPDPELERASGFLPPKISADEKRGFSYEQPYLWSISPYQYLIISPQLNASVNPLLNLDYMRRFYSGTLHVRGGFTNEAFFDNDGNRHGVSATREYLLADGAFKINEDWRWNFTAQHVKDESGDPKGDYANFFERYSIDGAFDQVGDLSVDSRQLINQFNVTRQVSNAYFAVTLANFQSLQVGGYLDSASGTSLQPYAITSDFFPTIAPQVEAYWSPKSRILGGQLTLSANAIGVYHKTLSTQAGLNAEDIGAPTGLLVQTAGYDTNRFSAGLNWQGDMTTASGIKWGPFIDARHDYYKVSNLDGQGLTQDISRDLATAGLNISYPMYRKFKGFTAIIEPVAQLAVSPEAQVSPYIPTEDSQSFEFDETTLFSFNKSSGFDIYEAGSRLNLGLRGELRFKSGLRVDGLLGRVLRNDIETQFMKTVAINGQSYTYDASGLGSQNSDWIATGSFDTGAGLNGYTRLRFDGQTGRLNQGEYGLTAVRANTQATLRYIVNNVLTPGQIQNYYSGYNGTAFDSTLQAARLAQLAANGKLKTFGDNYRDIQLYGQHFFTSHWGVSARIDRDMVSDTWRKSTVSVIYKDDCSWFELVYQQNDSALTTRNGKSSSSIFFRLNLTTLGTSPAKVNDVR
ncbi:LPS-assembly protein LptD [Asticcacaulis taihuensis]|uniref:LPS-assembly protein LptD n=1 Tax=Asticcacaulis taihuensis TaxID=260084 RepID=A0A1G4PFQ3_9CAUL|nr:LPS assembly protein LptD [Asticcacaulis taihuensis]SCW30849.1 LPS-assembly protein [Asticcacaulis taihuensis]